MKKMLVIIMLAVALMFGGCASNQNVQRTQSIDGDIEQLADGSIIISGGVDEDMYKEFVRFTLDGRQHYTIRLMTNGGCAYNTIAIMTRMEQLQKQGVKFTTQIMGHGFSAGAYIFMMGDERIMGSGANLMWHTMTGQTKFDSRTIPASSIELVHNMDVWVVGMFMKRFPHIEMEWIYETFWNSGRTWQTAKSALQMGIATKVLN